MTADDAKNSDAPADDAKRRFQEASIQFRNALQIDDNYAAAHWGLARAYEQLGRGNDYIEELQRTVKLDPNNIEARLRLALQEVAHLSL